MSTYSYKNPKFINSPKGVVEVVEVIYDGKDDPAYSLAIIKWENTYKLGIRWNIAYSEWDDYRKQNGQDECIGNPQSRGIPTWFVLPDDMMFGEKFSGAMQRLDEVRKGKEAMEQGEIILYQPDEAVKLEVRLEDETVWLTQEQIADLFGTKRPAITKHLNNIYKSGELDIDSTCSILEHMGNDGKQRYTTKYYNLDAILSIGYRVNSKNATLFRKWANSVLKDYLLKGYSINKRLSELERTVAQHTEKIDFFVRTALPPVEGIFYNGQIFDAYKFATDLVKSARRSIVLIDNYVDETVLLMLSKRSVGVSATIYTQRITQQLQLDLDRHNSQYPPIDIRTYRDSHDRFLIVDETDVYHIGASLKDLGKKMFAFSKLDIPAAVITDLL